MGKEVKLYNEGDIVMLKENLLKVKIVKVKRPFFSGTRFLVQYVHLPEDVSWQFPVSIREIDKVPSDYDQLIFNRYVELLMKYSNLLTMLRGDK